MSGVLGFLSPTIYFETNHGEEWALLLLGNKLSGDFLFCGAKAELGARDASLLRFLHHTQSEINSKRSSSLNE